MRFLSNLNSERRCGEQAVAGAKPVADDSVDNEGAVDFARRGEAFAAGKIAPLFRGDDAGGFEPFVRGVHLGDYVRSGGGGGANAGGATDTVQNILAEAIDLVVVCAHAFTHDLRRDVDHVGVAHAAAVDDIGHLHAGLQLVGLDLHGEDGNLRGFHVCKDGRRHIDEGARSEVFENEGVEGASALGELGSDRGSDWLGDAIGNEGDFLVGLDAQAGEDGGAGAGDEFGGVGLRKQARGGCGQACDDDAP